MTDPVQKPVWYRQIRWRLTLSYSLVFFLTIVAVESAILAVLAIYAYYRFPEAEVADYLWTEIRTLLQDDLLLIPVCILIGHAVSRGFSQRLELLVQAADAWARGLFDVRPEDDSQDEIGILTRRLQVMAAQLQNQVETEHELAAARERDRIARNLHDTVKQQLFAVGMEMTAVRNLLASEADAAAPMLDDAIEHIRQAQRDLNSLIAQTPPAGLDLKTLGTALREYIKQVNAFGIDITVNVTGDRDLPLAVEESLFRTVQGALSNVVRHSQATRASVDLEVGDADILLRVADDGIGFDPLGPSMSGFGLASMRTRVVEIGGTLEIDSRPGKGAAVMVRAPLPLDG